MRLLNPRNVTSATKELNDLVIWFKLIRQIATCAADSHNGQYNLKDIGLSPSVKPLFQLLFSLLSELYHKDFHPFHIPFLWWPICSTVSVTAYRSLQVKSFSQKLDYFCFHPCSLSRRLHLWFSLWWAVKHSSWRSHAVWDPFCRLRTSPGILCTIPFLLLPAYPTVLLIEHGYHVETTWTDDNSDTIYSPLHSLWPLQCADEQC
jgi:hypothetical protein